MNKRAPWCCFSFKKTSPHASPCGAQRICTQENQIDQTDRQTERQTDRLTDRQADRQADGKADRQAGRRTDRRTDRSQTGRQNNKEHKRTDGYPSYIRSFPECTAQKFDSGMCEKNARLDVLIFCRRCPQPPNVQCCCELGGALAGAK